MTHKAQDILAKLLNPVPYEQFFEEYVGRRLLHQHADERIDRAAICGADPKAAILGMYDEFSPKLTCHSGSAKLPPPKARRVASEQAFEALVREYHKVDYTVRIPDANNLSRELLKTARAIETIYENPANTAIFWSRAGANAPVHYDEVDLFIVQLTGRKRWFISAEPPMLPNPWKEAGEGAPPLERHHVVDVVPGDLIYLPRGTPHTVESTTESIHFAIGVLPVTVREAMNAVVDFFSGSDRAVRAGVTARPDDPLRGEGRAQAARRVRETLQALLKRCESDDYIHEALECRRARMIEDLPKLGSKAAGVQIGPGSRVRHHDLAMSHVLATPELVDFRLPGERVLVHRGAEESLRYIAKTPEFQVSEIPGMLGDDVKVALVGRLIASGFLVPVAGEK